MLDVVGVLLCVVGVLLDVVGSVAPAVVDGGAEFAGVVLAVDDTAAVVVLPVRVDDGPERSVVDEAGAVDDVRPASASNRVVVEATVGDAEGAVDDEAGVSDDEAGAVEEVTVDEIGSSVRDSGSGISLPMDVGVADSMR